MLSGLNHLTLAVCNLERSLHFYTTVLGAQCHARWDQGAYLDIGALWLCLALEPSRTPPPLRDYTHFALGIAAEDFARFVAQARALGVQEWKTNRSEGDSFYFLDPDQHQWEVHVGDLRSRLAACRAQPYAGMRFATNDA